MVYTMPLPVRPARGSAGTSSLHLLAQLGGWHQLSRQQELGTGWAGQQALVGLGSHWLGLALDLLAVSGWNRDSYRQSKVKVLH